MLRNIKYRFSVIFSLCCSAIVFNLNGAEPFSPQSFLPSDPEALINLKVYSTSSEISVDQLKKWDDKMLELLAKYTPPSGGAARIQAYLYNAQKIFATLSYNLSGKYAGSLDPISIHVLELFFPEYKPGPVARKSDLYSQELSKLIATQVDARFNTEQEQLKSFPEKTGKTYWEGKQPYVGIVFPSLKPWYLISCDQFRCPQPPEFTDSYWQLQLQAVKKAMKDATPKQKEAVYYWASVNKPTDGEWIWIANEYMDKQQLPLKKRLLVRAVLASTIEDSLIAVFDSKYTYWVKRPNMLDKDLKTLVQTPNHPSYPSGHSTIGAAAADVLAHFFPNNKAEWQSKADEAGHSRIWAGLHFPVDHEIGVKLGHKVAWNALNSTPLY